jgi:hypothetical protein
MLDVPVPVYIILYYMSIEIHPCETKINLDTYIHSSCLNHGIKDTSSWCIRPSSLFFLVMRTILWMIVWWTSSFWILEYHIILPSCHKVLIQHLLYVARSWLFAMGQSIILSKEAEDDHPLLCCPTLLPSASLIVTLVCLRAGWIILSNAAHNLPVGYRYTLAHSWGIRSPK